MLDDFIRELTDLQHNAQRIDGEHELSFEELFTDEFMLRNTDFESIGALIEASPFEVESSQDFESIPDAEWNTYISKTTRFTDWGAMKRKAGGEWAARQLGLE